jgi:hypothetical protein
MHTLRQNISIRSQAVLIFALIAVGWSSAFIEVHSWFWSCVDNFIFLQVVPILTLILLASFFLSGRVHARWFYSAMLVVVAAYAVMILVSIAL